MFLIASVSDIRPTFSQDSSRIVESEARETSLIAKKKVGVLDRFGGVLFQAGSVLTPGQRNGYTALPEKSQFYRRLDNVFFK